MHTQTGDLFKSLNRGVFNGGCIAMLATVIILTAKPHSITSSANSSMAPSMQMVDRSNKGDRLTFLSSLHEDNSKFPLTSPATLPVGCESVISSFEHSVLAQTAGRCVS
jgi:hypothetical protein